MGMVRWRGRARLSVAFTGSLPRLISKLKLSLGVSRVTQKTHRSQAQNCISTETAAITVTQRWRQPKQYSPENERIDFVSIVTPNISHFEIAKTFLDAGFHVVCDKPMTYSLDEAEALVQLVEDSGTCLCANTQLHGASARAACTCVVR